MYAVNEIFYSLQGEGDRAGTTNVFVRFAGCNLACSRTKEGFDCDTEFVSNVKMTGNAIIDRVMAYDLGQCRQVILTGGEPMLQVDRELLERFKEAGYFVALETNGTVEPDGFWSMVDYVACSPKTAEHTLRIPSADELRYVRNASQGIPKPAIDAAYLFVSPMATSIGIDAASLTNCVNLCLANPRWRLSVQQHKFWGVQ